MTKLKFLIPGMVVVISIACITKNKNKDEKPAPASASKTISDSALLDIVEKQTFQYFYDGAEPVSGMGREAFHEDHDDPYYDEKVVTSGGSGFGVMAILAGIHRILLPEMKAERLEKIVHFLKQPIVFMAHGLIG